MKLTGLEAHQCPAGTSCFFHLDFPSEESEVFYDFVAQLNITQSRSVTFLLISLSIMPRKQFRCLVLSKNIYQYLTFL